MLNALSVRVHLEQNTNHRLVGFIVNAEAELDGQKVFLFTLDELTYITFSLVLKRRASSAQNAPNCAVVAALGSAVLPIIGPLPGC